MMNRPLRKPEWIKTRIPSGESYANVARAKSMSGLATVCEEARCPNKWECWKNGTATFMLMGDTCTRSCRFCSVKSAKNPGPLDREEPAKLAETIKSLKLKYAVLTTVDRDDIPDFGAAHIISCVKAIREQVPEIIIELLIPDFQGNLDAINAIADCDAEVIGHNLECTENLTRTIRDPRASYAQSLFVLKSLAAHNSKIITKSSLMLGFGESETDVIKTMHDIKDTGVKILTLGQYLQPGKHNYPVQAYIHPDKFDWYKEKGLEMGFEYIASGPLVRSSYLAAEHYLELKLSRKTKTGS